MPAKPLVLKVNIRKKPNNDRECEVIDHFVATPGSDVIFVFPGMPQAEIVFNGPSPFTTPRGHLGSNKVKGDAPAPQDHSFTVTWAGGGNGNGTGEVIPV
jgi:hypothetical protein